MTGINHAAVAARRSLPAIEATDAGPQPRPRNATILIVDDLPANRKLLVTLLGHQGHQLLEAANGREGLEIIEARRPDLVITDVLMPVMDGYELVRQLRLNPAINHIPVVFYTAHYGESEARALAASMGVADVVTKPASSADVLAVVARALEGGAAGRTALPTLPRAEALGREHLQLITDKLSSKTEDLRAANARLRGLINIGLELASERDADRLLQHVCDAACDLFGAACVTLGLVDAEHTVRAVIACGLDAGSGPDVGAAVTGLFATVVGERRTVRGENPGGDPARVGLPASHQGAEAFVVAPLASPTQVYGWLCLVGQDGQTFTEDDEQLVTVLASQVGRIYENGHLYDVATLRARALEREISEREQVESALRHERDRAQRYLDTAEVMLLALDRRGCVTLLNRQGCQLLGWTEQELHGRDFIETCMPQRVHASCRAQFAALVDGGPLSAVEPVLTRSGHERLIEWRNTVMRDAAGEVVGTFSSGADITERRLAVEGRRVADERTRFALEATGAGIWDMDLQSGVLEWSGILESQDGLAPGAFGGTLADWLARVHPDDRAALVAVIESANRTGRDFSEQHRAQWADGTVRWLSSSGRTRLDEQGAPQRSVGISFDVTDRRAREDHDRQAQKMDAMGRLAGGVAHDFNNLLTAILGYCGLVRADFGPDDPHQADLVEIQRAAERGAGLTRQLLAFSRREIIEPTRLDLNLVVTDMRQMLGRLIEENVTVVLALDPHLGPVKADCGQVEQIVLNLAVNARDAMPNGGTLTILTSNVELSPPPHQAPVDLRAGSYVVLAVGDTGTGMTAAVRAQLFEPFFTTKEPGKGTGLGLSTVHGIVRRSGGAIRVESAIGRGTTFTVYFPRVDGERPVPTPPPLAARPGVGTETVLVVDDDAGLRLLTRRVLGRLGYTVLEAANADEAARAFDYAHIDVILTDVVMPGASGPELTRQLVEQRPALRVLYMSGYTEEAIQHHGGLGAGMAFLHKPFTADTLGEKIREVLDA